MDADANARYRHLISLEPDARLLGTLGELGSSAIRHDLVVQRLPRAQERVPPLLVGQLVAPLPHPRRAARVVVLSGAKVRLLGPAVVMFLAYRAYVQERSRHRSLEFLYDVTRTVHRAPTVGEPSARWCEQHERHSVQRQARADATPGDEGGADMCKLGLTLAPASRVSGSGAEGVVITGVDPTGTAADQGFSTGDVILEV